MKILDELATIEHAIDNIRDICSHNEKGETALLLNTVTVPSYGSVYRYFAKGTIVDEQRCELWRQLTGKKTISDAQILALKELTEGLVCVVTD